MVHCSYACTAKFTLIDDLVCLSTQTANGRSVCIHCNDHRKSILILYLNNAKYPPSIKAPTLIPKNTDN